MKNIFLLQTDQITRLQSNKHGNLFLSEKPKDYAKELVEK